MKEPSSKRFEENIKFIFKITFRKLKLMLLKRFQISVYSKKFDDQFYDHYFKDLVEGGKYKMEDFYDPLNTKNNLKTLNNDYLALVFESPEFKRDFISYISGADIQLDYQKTIKRKLTHLLSKFDGFFEGDNQEVGIQKIQKYFRKNKQCKLPWTQTEICTAVNTFMFLIKSIK